MGLIVLIAVEIILVCTLLFLNLRTCEKLICCAVAPEFTVPDPQFLLNMGQLLEPTILGGSRIVALHNGDQIFPAMLAAIR